MAKTEPPAQAMKALDNQADKTDKVDKLQVVLDKIRKALRTRVNNATHLEAAMSDIETILRSKE